MLARLFACFAGLLTPTLALAQYGPPTSLDPGAPPRTYEQQELPPLPSAPALAAPSNTAPPPQPAAPLFPAATSGGTPTSGPTAERVFCAQAVPVTVAEADAVPERFRPFVGIWSDASWTPQLCAALIVENVTADGTATIVYAFGPMTSGSRAPGGVLRGTGVVKDNELRFQNSDGSQYSFRPIYSDLNGTYTTAQGQTYSAIFKKTP